MYLYTIAENSPLLQSGTCQLIGGQGVGCTVGVEPTTWSRIKARYRQASPALTLSGVRITTPRLNPATCTSAASRAFAPWACT